MPSQSTAIEVELRRLAREDQADRRFTHKPTPRQEATMSRHDESRRRRGRALLATAPRLSAEGFSDAALIFQHGASAADHALAHGLSLCGVSPGKAESLPALSEDRYLTTIGRRQRFGTQFSGFGDQARLKPVDEILPTAVTDELRLCYLVPPLEMARTLGLAANQKAQDRLFAHLEKRRNPHDPLVGDATISAEIASLPASNAARLRVLKLYGAHEIVTDDDYEAAARVLSSSSDPSVLILAHEFAALAVLEGRRSAGPLAAETWRRFNASIGRASDLAPYPAMKAALGLPGLSATPR